MQRYGDPEVDSRSVLFNGEVDVTDYLTFYSYGLYTRRETLSNGFFRPAGDSRNIPSIYPDGFLPIIAPTVATTRAPLVPTAVAPVVTTAGALVAAAGIPAIRTPILAAGTPTTRAPLVPIIRAPVIAAGIPAT